MLAVPSWIVSAIELLPIVSCCHLQCRVLVVQLAQDFSGYTKGRAVPVKEGLVIGLVLQEWCSLRHDLQPPQVDL